MDIAFRQHESPRIAALVANQVELGGKGSTWAPELMVFFIFSALLQFGDEHDYKIRQYRQQTIALVRSRLPFSGAPRSSAPECYDFGNNGTGDWRFCMENRHLVRLSKERQNKVPKEYHPDLSLLTFLRRRTGDPCFNGNQGNGLFLGLHSSTLLMFMDCVGIGLLKEKDQKTAKEKARIVNRWIVMLSISGFCRYSRICLMQKLARN